MTAPRVLLVVNPVASGADARSEGRVLEALRAWCTVDVVRTEERDHAGQIAAAAVAEAACDALVVLAGDGTANEIINGAGPGLPLGFLPCGGTSVLPRALGVPGGLEAAARATGLAIRDGRERSIELGLLQGRRFAFNAGIGIDAEVVRAIDTLGRSNGRRPGDFRFAFAAMKAFASGGYATPVLTLEVPGAEPIRAASLIAANAAPWSYVGPLPLQAAPLARFEGGLDLVAPRSLRARDLPRLARALATGAHARGGNPGLPYLADVIEARVVCDLPLPAQVDGEDLGDVTEVVLGIEPEGARVVDAAAYA